MQDISWGDKLKIGNLELANRVIMPSLTRQRCTLDGVPTELVAEYYAQRASAGLIVTETTAWCQRGKTSAGSPCLFNEEHAKGWKLVTDAVHNKGGKIFVQINHAGRATNTEMTKGLQTWAPSEIGSREKVRYLGGNLAPMPHSMTLEEIKETQEEFRESMRISRLAGFDGIQIQGAHGYLVDQFLRSCTNSRTDSYGGSVENRCLFCLQLFDIALEFYPSEFLALRISPVSRAKDMFDQNPQETFGYLLKELSKKKIGIVELRESTQPYNFTNHYGVTSKDQLQNVCRTFRPYFTGLLIGNDSFTPESGLEKIRSGDCDAISFGQLFIGNPDLADRAIHNYPLNKNIDKATFYGNAHGSKGYTDYPAYSQNK